MKKTIFDFVTGETTQTEFTNQEITEFEARKTAYATYPEPARPTEEQLLIELAALTEKIKALA